jgi:hypothetical protein
VRRSVWLVPSDWTGDDGRLGVFAVAVRWLLPSSGLMCGWADLSVVVGSPGGVVEHGVGGEDLLQCRVGHDFLCFVVLGAGVGMVAVEQGVVGVGDLGWGGAGRNSQGGVVVGPVGHGVSGGRWWWMVVAPGVGRGRGGRRTVARPARKAGRSGAGVAQVASGAAGWDVRAGRTVTSCGLVCGDHLPFCLWCRVSGAGGERCRADPPMPGGRGRETGPRTGSAARRAGPRSGFPPAVLRPGLAVGGSGHAAAMIASNSAVSRSGSLQSRSRKSSSSVRAAVAPVAGVVGMTGPCRVRR